MLTHFSDRASCGRVCMHADEYIMNACAYLRGLVGIIFVLVGSGKCLPVACVCIRILCEYVCLYVYLCVSIYLYVYENSHITYITVDASALMHEYE